MTATAPRPIHSPLDLREATGADFTVSDEQWAAISADLGPAVVIAGAGSGKTELMAARVVYLVGNGLVRPDEVLGLTFTTKATSELAARIRAQLTKAGLDRGPISDDGIPERLEPTISTYNAYAAGLLADHGLRIGFEPDLRVMADASRFQLASRVIQQHEAVVSALSDHPATVVGYLLALEGAMSEHLLDVDDVRAFHAAERPRFEATLQRLVAEGGRTKGQQDKLAGVLAKMTERDELLGLVEDYRSLKAELGLIDFSDQVAGACRLATEQPQVGQAQREEFKVVLLDEYQDTSVAQARMLAGLFGGAADPAGRGHAVMAVGDPNQAIYGWRGASVANIETFPEEFSLVDGGPAPVLRLTVNRRSDRAILDLANELVTPLLQRPGAVVAPLVAKDDADAGEVRTAYHRTDTDELAWLVEQVRHAHDVEGVAWKEIGVLVRTNKHGAEAYDVLTDGGIPVEIVGLGGLIRLPEVAQVVATLSLLDDLTDNAALLTLLTGPRWQVGTRDLALLGQRSSQLARVDDAESDHSFADEVAASVAGVDPTEIPSLNEALEDLGDLPYSPEARQRFAALADELRYLRGFVGEPLLDLMRRIMDVTGLDVELASATSDAARARRENLDLFVKAVADFQAVDGAVTLTALNAWLETEDDYGGGLDLAPPSESDTVKLLTIHRAKGLEYDVVHLIGVAAKRFPNTTLRPQWTSQSAVLPVPLRGDAPSLPQLSGHEPGDIWEKFASDGQECFEEQARRHQADEELRLAYVAFTRARHRFVVSSFHWTSTKNPFEPSPYLVSAQRSQEAAGGTPTPWYAPEPEEPNPVTDAVRAYAWPATERGRERLAREAAARLVADAAGDAGDPPGLSPEEQARLALIDREVERLLAEARAESQGQVEVSLPPHLSATALAQLRTDRDAFVAELARPMPRPPAPAARFGTRFHAWVEERFGQQDLIDFDEIPGRADAGIDSDTDLAELTERFEAGEFADRVPFAVEAPFSLVLDGQVVRGRIDAVYEEPDGSFLVIDWKTGRSATADPLQLAIYRLAWAELQELPLDRVAAAFHYVRTGRTVRHDDLPGREALEALLPD